MSHIEEARKSTQMVVKLLVTRFGSQEEVFGHLTDVLRHIGEAEAEFARVTVQPEAVAAVEVAESGPGPSKMYAVRDDGSELAEVRVEESSLPAPIVTVPEMGADASVLATRAEPEAAPEPEVPMPKRRARRKRGNA